ncbi:MAG: hypothetical protein E7426_09000 [Ruminococcaceae bacterium]|nr:hypothetical protein [Oscillospiraceae bacterium]
MAAYVCFCGNELIPALPPDVVGGDAPGPWVLCAMTAAGAARMANHRLICRTLLIPEGLYRPVWQAEQVVGYGLSGHSTLTLSSMGRRDMLCVQRTLTDSSGRIVEQQELPLPGRWGVFPPSDRLLLAGVWLLRGVPPEET